MNEEIEGKEWFYLQGAAQRGPFSEAELVSLQREGRISGETQVWQKGQGAWKQLAEALPAISETPPAPPGVQSLVTHGKRAKHEPWSDLRPHPWRRLFARTFDMYVNGFVLILLGSVLLSAAVPTLSATWQQYAAESGNEFAVGYLVVLLGFSANVLLVGLTGTTLGKWIFGIRVTRQDGHSMGIGIAFKRELAVFLRGYALGIPIIYLFTMGSAYRTLTDKNITSWDEEYSLHVSQRHNSVVQTLAGTVALSGLVAGLVALNMSS